jgi:hypothetical protein
MKILLWISSFVGLLGVPLTASVTVDIKPNPKACTEVRLPRWKLPDDPRSFCSSPHLAFRSVQGGLLVAVSCARPNGYGPPIWDTYLPNKFAITFGSSRLPRVVDDLWNKASTVSVSRNPPGLSPGPFRAAEAPLLFDRKEFESTGSRRGLGAGSWVSPNKGFLSVNSWDGVISVPEGFMPGRSKLDGHYYVDVYQVDPKQKVLSISGEFHGENPVNFFSLSAWLEDRLFFLPLDEHIVPNRFLVCQVPQ